MIRGKLLKYFVITRATTKKIQKKILESQNINENECLIMFKPKEGKKGKIEKWKTAGTNKTKKTLHSITLNICIENIVRMDKQIWPIYMLSIKNLLRI